MLNNINIANRASTANAAPYNPNNDKIRNKLIECITLIMQAKEDLFTASDKNIVLANLKSDLNQYSKYLSLEHLEVINSINKKALEAIDSFEYLPINELMTNEKYKSFAKLYSDTIDKYGRELKNSYNEQNNDTSGYNDSVGLPLVIIIMNCTLDMLAINLMASNSYANSVKLYQKAADAVALLQAMAQKMNDFYSKLANKRQEILSDIKNKKGKYKDWDISNFLDPGNTVSMDDKDFKTLCDECGYPCNKTDNLINGFKELLSNNNTLLMALKNAICPKCNSKNEAIEIIAKEFAKKLGDKIGTNQNPKNILKEFLEPYKFTTDLEDFYAQYSKCVEKYGPNNKINYEIELKSGEFPEGVADFFKVEKDKDGKIIKCIVTDERLNAMVRFISQQAALVLSDSSTNPYGYIYDTYSDALKDQVKLTNGSGGMISGLGNKSKQIQDNSSTGLVSPINLCQQNVQVFANFFDKICEIFKQLSR